MTDEPQKVTWNPTHLEVVRRGAEAIDAWRAASPDESMNLSGANLRRASLRGANLEGARLEGARLEGADLKGANLRWADLRRANLGGAKLRSSSLAGANLTGANLAEAILVHANLDNANLRFADLESAQLSDAQMLGAAFGHANLKSATLRGANLEGADLSGAYVVLASLEQCQLRHACLMGADLTGARLWDADLRWADFRYARLNKADLSGTVRDGIQIKGAVLDSVDFGATESELSDELARVLRRLPDIWSRWKINDLRLVLLSHQRAKFTFTINNGASRYLQSIEGELRRALTGNRQPSDIFIEELAAAEAVPAKTHTAGPSDPGPRSDEPEAIELRIDYGDATTTDVAEALSALSDLYRAHGGPGLIFTPGNGKIVLREVKQ